MLRGCGQNDNHVSDDREKETFYRHSQLAGSNICKEMRKIKGILYPCFKMSVYLLKHGAASSAK